MSLPSGVVRLILKKISLLLSVTFTLMCSPAGFSSVGGGLFIGGSSDIVRDVVCLKQDRRWRDLSVGDLLDTVVESARVHGDNCGSGRVVSARSLKASCVMCFATVKIESEVEKVK